MWRVRDVVGFVVMAAAIVALHRFGVWLEYGQ